MRKIAFIDLDGVVADSTKRFEQATTPDGKINWNIALNSERVHLDTPIDGALLHLQELEAAGYAIFFLTSRPWHMTDATVSWLETYDFGGHRLEMKPEEDKFTKTVAWKARRLKELVQAFGANPVLFVDDEQANRDEAVRQLPDLHVFATLQEAAAAHA